MRRDFRQALLVALVAALCCTSLPGQTVDATKYRITGLVVNARDSSPVRHCHLTAVLSGTRREAVRETPQADTDESGRFSIVVPSAGNWQLNASAYNIRTQPFEDHGGFYTGVVLTAAAPTYDLVFRAMPDAVLRGIVSDEAGEPVRNAQVALFSVDPAGRQTGGSSIQQRQGTETDGAGRYELASLESGDYMIQVQARPWYAATNTNVRRPLQNPTPSLDPSLDVVYPATWYPGVTDSSSAGVLTAHPGDALQADFRLLPVASAHLLIPSSAPPVPQGNRPNGNSGPGLTDFRQSASISMLLPNGNLQQVFTQTSRNEAGDLDISGLAPGVYQVTTPGSGPDAPSRTATIHVQAGGSTSDLGASLPATAVTVSVDGGTSANASQISLVSSATGQVFYPFNRMEMGGRFPGANGPPSSAGQIRGQPQSNRGGQSGQRSRPGNQSSGPASRGRGRSSGSAEDVTVQVPPGQYEVKVQGDAFLTGITSKGATAMGRMVTISDTSATLVVHLASGLANVSGVATTLGKVSIGALVLLVPATLGDVASLTIVRRDQTNTDGSFRLDEVIPGQYILVSIDHGWGVRWTDPATLTPYLMRGMPLDLRSGSTTNPKLASLPR